MVIPGRFLLLHTGSLNLEMAKGFPDTSFHPKVKATLKKKKRKGKIVEALPFMRGTYKLKTNRARKTLSPVEVSQIALNWVLL